MRRWSLMKRNRFDSIAHGTSLEYHKQGNRSNLKSHFFRLREVLRGVQKNNFGGEKYFLDPLQHLLKSKLVDYPVYGTLNLCHETLIAHEKESIWSNRSVLRKRPKSTKISVFLFDLTIVENYWYFGTFSIFSRYRAIGSNWFLFMGDQRLMAQV